MNEASVIALLKNLQRQSRSNIIVGIGDDTAVIKQGHLYLLMTCDTQVEGTHFLKGWMGPSDIGKRAIGTAVSDIAAMGGEPAYCLMTLGIPEGTPDNFTKALVTGVTQACKQYNIDLIGGNTTRAKQLFVDIFLLGNVHPKQLILQSTASPGDKVLVTGTLGERRVGLAMLKNQLRLPQKEKNALTKKFQSVIPRLKESALIAKSRKATAMIDLSDGLAIDLKRLCQQSDVGVTLFVDKLPISKAVVDAAKKLSVSPVDLALAGGEDYELCFTTKAADASSLAKLVEGQTGTPVSIIGDIVKKSEGRWLIDAKGRKRR